MTRKTKQAFRSRKARRIGFGAALAGGAAIVALLPSAQAAEEKTPLQIMTMCQRSKVLNGKQQSVEDFGGGFADGFMADKCDFVETKFETFNGPTEKVTPGFPNCEENATEPATAKAEWTATVAQGEGRYLLTEQGAQGGLFGILSGSWQKHKATLDMSMDSASAGGSEEKKVPVGKVLHMEFTRKMQRMTGVWKVHSDAREATTVLNPQPEVNLEAEEVVEGPYVVASAAGKPGVAGGTVKPVLTNCPKRT